MRGGGGDGEEEQTGTCTFITYSLLSLPSPLSPSLSVSFSFFSPLGSECTYPRIYVYPRVSDYTWAVCLMASRCRAVVRHESAIHSRRVRCIYAAGSYPSAIREISHKDIRARHCRRRTFSPRLAICLPRDPIPSATSTPASAGRKREPRIQ